LSYILYPWRFLSVALFCAAVLGAWFTDKIATGKFVVSLLLITAAMLTSRHYNHISAASTSGEDFYKLYSGTATSENEYFPKNASLSIVKFAEPSVEVIEGEGEIVSLSKRPSQWNIELSLKQPSRIKLALLSFPGWTIYRNGEKISYDSRYKLFPGLISIFLPSGFSKISVKFEETNLRKIGDAISLSCIFYLFSLLKYRLGDVR
ncbi:hypothetical protein HYS11_00005, partial [Candidatus Gottesmanbacteria bacterium]|nr:hypothetical protein [Candidatus Gottesmanbacteria bacterium]